MIIFCNKKINFKRLKHLNHVKLEFDEKSKSIEYDKELAFKNFEVGNTVFLKVLIVLKMKKHLNFKRKMILNLI